MRYSQSILKEVVPLRRKKWWSKELFKGRVKLKNKDNSRQFVSLQKVVLQMVKLLLNIKEVLLSVTRQLDQ